MVNLAEFESVLTGHPDVQRALATTIRHGGRDVVIGVVECSTYMCGLELREYVWQRLGTGCGLDGVLAVEDLPLVGEALDADRVRSAVISGECTVFESPADPVEERLLSIWAGAMNRNWIGVHDDFLDLGGDSVIATRILAEIEEEFGETLDAYDFMEAYNIRGVADMLRKGRVATPTTS
jgi:hypothetical protein